VIYIILVAFLPAQFYHCYTF